MTDDAQVAEFDTVADWTVQLVSGRDRATAVACACRGSGGPVALAWLAESLQLTERTRFVDIGSGLGGPAAWLADRYQVAPVLCDPMVHAARGARRLFGLPTVCGDAEHLPWATGTFDAAWMIAMLDTTGWPLAALREAARVLTRTGRLGLLAYVATGPIPSRRVPAGNHFQTEAQLHNLVRVAGFTVADRTDRDRLPPAPSGWEQHQQHLTAELNRGHRDDPRWQQARRQEMAFTSLLDGGSVTAVALNLARNEERHGQAPIPRH